jgi:hypothetical protein
MPHERTITVYYFDELSKEARDKAVEALNYLTTGCNWWEDIYEDARTIGLEIEEFTLCPEFIKVSPLTELTDIANAILHEHGELTATYRLAEKYLDGHSDGNFVGVLGEAYLKMIGREYDDLSSRKRIVEVIRAKEYEFDIDGKVV